MRTGLRPEDLGPFLAEPLVAILATRRRDDTTMLSPVWYEWRDGGINVWAHGEEDGKVRHLRRDPRVTIVVANSTWPYKGIEVRGEAVIGTEDFYGVLERTARRYMGEASAKRMVASYEAPGVVIRIDGDVRAWDYEDEA